MLSKSHMQVRQSEFAQTAVGQNTFVQAAVGKNRIIDFFRN
jgi:hypothetical protein